MRRDVLRSLKPGSGVIYDSSEAAVTHDKCSSFRKGIPDSHARMFFDWRAQRIQTSRSGSSRAQL